MLKMENQKLKTDMDAVEEKKKNDILYHAEKCLFYNSLLIEQCDNWLSEEEGYENMLNAYMERMKMEAGIFRRNRFLRFFGKKTEKSQKLQV